MFKIRWKLLVSVIIGALLLNVALYAVAQKELMPVLDSFEMERVQTQLSLGYGELFHPVEQMYTIAKDYAFWNDTYAFVESPSEGYINSNLVVSTFSNFELNFIVICNLRGEIIYGAHYDRDEGLLTPLSQDFKQDLLQEPRLWTLSEDMPAPRGYYPLGSDIYGMVAVPILDSNEEGPSRGTLLMGQHFDEEALEEFSEDWGHNGVFEVLEVSTQVVGGKADHFKQFYDVTEKDDKVLMGLIHVRDIFGQPLLDLVTPFSRDFSLHGKNILDTMMLWNLIICLLFTVVFYLAVDKALTSRELKEVADDKYEKLSEEFETILDGIPNPLMHISPDNRVLWANKVGASLLAETSPSTKGKYVSHVEFVSGFEGSDSAVELCVKSKKEEKNIAETSDGRVLKEYAYPLLGADEEVTSVVRVVVDITESVRLRSEADQNGRLASLGELAAGVAHEINNPIGMLLMNLRLLTDIQVDLKPILDDYHEHNPDLELGNIPYPVISKKIPYLLKEMTAGGLRIKGIVQDLKGFTRKDVDADMSQVEVNDIASAAVRLVAYQLGKATANFTENYAEDLPAIKGDYRRIEQVVINLLINATQALENRDQEIGISTKLTKGAKFVVIEVEDGGKGIARENIDRILDPFFTTRRNEGGTGLGLSLSARIAEEHGGSLKVFSAPGSNTVIGIQLPVITENV